MTRSHQHIHLNLFASQRTFSFVGKMFNIGSDFFHRMLMLKIFQHFLLVSISSSILSTYSLFPKSTDYFRRARRLEVLEEASLDGVVKYIKSNKCKNIITMAGAGISTSAGIPDFRSPGSGLYHNLQKYNLPYPEAIFELDFLRQNPKPFFVLAKELFPGMYKPTPGHYFIRLLQDKGLLLRHYTQNIDMLERVAGIRMDKLVEAHGSFHTSHCLNCSTLYDQEWMKAKVFSDEIPTCEHCGGIVKPDIVFFGENLPDSFFVHPQDDFAKCDLLIIMGSSLIVQPFASLKDLARDDCPRLLINRELVGADQNGALSIPGLKTSSHFNPTHGTRDVFYEGMCDDGCQLLADKLGWGEELRQLIRREHERIDKESVSSNRSTASSR